MAGMEAQMTDLAKSISGLLTQSKRGSDLLSSDLNKLFFFQVHISDIVWSRSGISSLTVLQCFGRVFIFAVRMAQQYLRKNFDEVRIIQPATRFLFNGFCSLILGDNAEIRKESPYNARGVHIHGKIDSGVFRPGVDVCFLSNEDKRSDRLLSKRNISQAAGELNGCIEQLRGFGLNPLIFNSLLNSGREWKLLRRILHQSQPLFQYTSSLYLFDENGVVDINSVYLLTKMLLHCFSNARDLVNSSKVPVAIGYGTVDQVDTDDDTEDVNEEEEKKSDSEPTEKGATLSRRAAKSESSGKIGLKSKGRCKTRKFGTLLTIENMKLHDAASITEPFANWGGI